MAYLTRRAIIAIDIGTSKIKAMLYDPALDQVLRRSERSTFDCRVKGLPPGWSEASPLKILDLTNEVLEEMVALAGQDTSVAAITLTGAMHGILLTNAKGVPLTNLIEWRDQRVLDDQPKLGASTLGYFLKQYGSYWASLKTGCQVASGYGLMTLYWFAVTDVLPQGPAYLCTIVDFVAAQLSGKPFITDYSLAASTGLFDIIDRAWRRDFMATFGAKNIQLPEVVPANTSIGGAWQGIKVLAPSGDHAAAAYAVLRERVEDAHINIGTGSQVAVYCSKPYFDNRLETRLGLTDDFLLVSAGAVGGHTLDSWTQMIGDMFPISSKPSSFNELLLEAERISVGCDGLSMRPIFSGTRVEPSLRGRIDGISPTNFTIGHLTRACLEGIAREWAKDMGVISEHTGQTYETIFLTGRLAANNDLFRRIVEQELDIKANVVSDSDISMIGAAQHAKNMLSL